MTVVCGPFFFEVAGDQGDLFRGSADGDIEGDQVGVVVGELVGVFFGKAVLSSGLVAADLISFIISQAGQVAAGGARDAVDRIVGECASRTEHAASAAQ